MIGVVDILAVDPLALILSNEAYIRLTLPDPPPDEVIATRVKQVVARLKPEEKARALAGAKALGAYANALEKALSKTQRGNAA
jgi:hypothetical protein